MSWLSDIFGGSNKEQGNPEQTKIWKPQETASGSYSLPILKNRAAGQGVAFDPSQLTMYGNPYGEYMMRQYDTKLAPQIAENYASRGLSNSNLAAGDQSNALADVMSNIGVNWADLNKWNEQMKQSGIENAMSGLANYTNQELNQRNKEADLKQAGYDTKAQNLAAQKAQEQGMAQGMLGAGLNATGSLVSSMVNPFSAITDMFSKGGTPALGNTPMDRSIYGGQTFSPETYMSGQGYNPTAKDELFKKYGISPKLNF